MAKKKIHLEYPMRCQPEILYQYLASADGLSEWFADEVRERGDDFYFKWDGGEPEKATMIRYKTEGFARYRWEEDEGTKYYFEFSIVVDEITEDISLNITDFADEGDEDDVRQYWNNAIENLQSLLGAA